MRKLKTIEINRLSVEAYRHTPKIPLVIILDDVRSQYNVGSIFRTADAFAVKKILLCGITAYPPTHEIHKTALGAENSVEWQYFDTASQAIEILHADGYMVFVAEQCEGSKKLPLQPLATNQKYAVILGNEVKGVSQEAINKCDGCFEIPQFGTKHSLNVAVAAGIVAWEFSRQLRINDKF